MATLAPDQALLTSWPKCPPQKHSGRAGPQQHGRKRVRLVGWISCCAMVEAPKGPLASDQVSALLPLARVALACHRELLDHLPLSGWAELNHRPPAWPAGAPPVGYTRGPGSGVGLDSGSLVRVIQGAQAPTPDWLLTWKQWLDSYRLQWSNPSIAPSKHSNFKETISILSV